MSAGNVVDLKLAQLQYWCQTVLPAVFDDSLSYYELLAKVIDKLNEELNSINQLVDIVGENCKDIAELQELFKKFIESGFDDYYRDQIEKWFNENAFRIYQLIAKQVFFGVTKDGYFCAYVPDSWKEITFDTGAVFGRSDYGRLCLKFDSEGQGVIDNTYSYSLNDWQVVSNDFKKALIELTADLETNSKRTDSVFDTVYTNIDQELGRDGENV